MCNIAIYDTTTRNFLIQYESIIPPMVGDIYGGNTFDDCNQRVITLRLLITTEHMLDSIIVYAELSYPEKLYG